MGPPPSWRLRRVRPSIVLLIFFLKEPHSELLGLRVRICYHIMIRFQFHVEHFLIELVLVAVLSLLPAQPLVVHRAL